MLLEVAGEVLGIFKAKLVSHLRHRHAANHQALGTVNEEMLDDACGAIAGGVAHHVAEVTRREAQLRGAVFHAWHPVPVLQLALIVVAKYLMEPGQQVALLG